MLQLALILISTTFSSHTWADCSVSDGKKIVKIPETKTVSLVENGKSLSSHKIQDQDGVGTCYANSTSAVLKTVLPGNPDVSYLHAAINTSTNGWAEDHWDWSKRPQTPNYKTEQENFTAGGQVCETIAAMKKAGGACPAKFSFLEDGEKMTPENQSLYLDKLGIYFDQINEIKKDPAKFLNYKKYLGEVVNSLPQIRETQRLKCEEGKKPINLAVDRIQIIMSNYIRQALEADNPCAKKFLNVITQTLALNIDPNADNVKIQLSQDLRSKLSSLLENDQNFNQSLTMYLENENDDEVIRAQVASRLMNKLNHFFQFTKPIDSNFECPNNYLKEDSEMAKFNISSIHHLAKQDCNKLELDKEVIENILVKNMCEDTYLKSLVTNQVTELLNLGLKIEDGLLPDLTNTMTSNGNQITKILMPDCNDKENLIPMNKVSCATFSTCDESQYYNTTNNTYSGPVGGCYGLASAKTIIGTQIFNSIENNRSLSISVCPDFLFDPAFDSKYGQISKGAIEGHSLHSMAISGYRCINGKLEYELLNSWGATCPTPEDLKNTGVKCVLDENGNPTGRFWVKEDLLIKNTRNINVIKVNK